MTIKDDPTPEILGTETVYSNPFLTVKRIHQRMPFGNTATYFVREEADVAVCLPVTSDGLFVMLKEFRAGPGKYLMEIPGGSVDRNEEPELAARRETIEEVGYDGQLVHLATTFVSAYSTARKHIYLMLDAVKVAEPICEPQDLAEPYLLDKESFLSVVSEGNLTDLDAALAAVRYLGL
ncbi:NUDIX hydrolase [Phyllobacterium sp. K27]